MPPLPAPDAVLPSALAALNVAGFVRDFWPILLPCALGLAAVYLLLPRAQRFPPLWGGVLAGLAVLVAGWWLIRFEVASPEALLFYAFALIAVVSGGLLLTQSNPVYAALSFALVVLSTCGLFLLLAAPFLMAATIIIYAGAIVVTFLFVIMLAQQHGPSNADQRSREPFLSAMAGFILLGATLCVLQRTYATAGATGLEPLDTLLAKAQRAGTATQVAEIREAIGDGPDYFDNFVREVAPEEAPNDKLAPVREELKTALLAAQVEWIKRDSNWPDANAKAADIAARMRAIHKLGRSLRDNLAAQVALPGTVPLDEKLPVSHFSGAAASEGRRPQLPAENVAGLGRSLFTDYLLAVEVAGFLLLVATIGAIAIAARRTEGLR